MVLNVLIYGGNGWIGGMMANMWSKMYPEDNIVLSSTRVQPNNEDLLLSEIEKADRVICLMGRTSGYSKKYDKWINTIDYLEDELFENVRDNLYSPILLGLLCQKVNKHLLYLGTGCIFSWNTNKNQDREVLESDYPDFFGSSYSIIKGFTDDLTRLLPNVCNCRIRMPIIGESHSRNFITKIVGYKNIHNMINSMTYLPEMIPIMIELSRCKEVGTFNCTNPGYIDHATILNLYKKYVDNKHEYTLVEEEKDLQLLSKRSNNILNTNKLEMWCKEHKLQLSNIKDAIEQGLKEWM